MSTTDQILKFRNRFFGRLLPALNRLRRKHVEHILPLGTNCEIGFWLFDTFGSLDSSLFTWVASLNLAKMTRALENFDGIMGGEATFLDATYMWLDHNTEMKFHGRLTKRPSEPAPDAETLRSDLADLRGRVAHHRRKFLEYIADDRSTLFVHRLSAEDATSSDLDERLLRLETALTALGARNWKLLIVCEKPYRKLVPLRPNRIVRSVWRFNPPNNIPDKSCGDYAGWHAIFSEFVPTKIPPKTHRFKFE